MGAETAILNEGLGKADSGLCRDLEHPGRGNSLSNGPRWERV